MRRNFERPGVERTDEELAGFRDSLTMLKRESI